MKLSIICPYCKNKYNIIDKKAEREIYYLKEELKTCRAKLAALETMRKTGPSVENTFKDIFGGFT